MTATAQATATAGAAAAAARATPAVPAIWVRPPSATLVGGVFTDVHGLLKALRGLRATGATEDIIGLVIPLGGDPTTPEGLASLSLPRPKRGLDLANLLLTALDPHRPPPEPATLTRGYNSPLATLVLGDLAGWLVGVRPFRVPVDGAPDGGVWVLGRPSHAAAVAGARGAAAGGSTGALAALGLTPAQARVYAAHVAAGKSVLTTCETDAGRVKRDLKLLTRCGVTERLETLLLSEQRAQP